MTKKRKHKKTPESTAPSAWLSSHGFFIAIALSLLLASVFGWYRITRPDALPFTKIQIVGELNRVDKNELNQMVLSSLNGGFFSLDVQGLRQRVASLPWIEDAAVRRIWPDVLQVDIDEQQPVAIWNGDFLINGHGDLFRAATDSEGLEIPVRLDGPEGMHLSLLSYYQSLQGQLAQHGLAARRVSVNGRRAMQVWLSNGVQLRLGRVRDELDSSIELNRFLTAYKKLLAPKLDRIDYVDLRYTNGLAVRWRELESDLVEHETMDEQNNNSTALTG